MKPFNYVKTNNEDKNVKGKNTIMIDDDKEKQKLKRELAELKKELYRKEKELQQIHMSFARW